MLFLRFKRCLGIRFYVNRINTTYKRLLFVHLYRVINSFCPHLLYYYLDYTISIYSQLHVLCLNVLRYIEL